MEKLFDKIFFGSKTEYYRKVHDVLLSGNKSFVVTANPETIVMALKSDDYMKILTSPRVTIVPDGIGVIKTAGYLGYTTNGRITGVELSEYLLSEANNLHLSVLIYGTTEEILNDVRKTIDEKFQGIKKLYTFNGYTSDEDSIISILKNETIDIIFVALGIPKQELFIDKVYEYTDRGVFVGVGGSFDVISGNKKRAPEFFINNNLEWLYRVAKEPKRLSRFLKSNIVYVVKSLELVNKRRKKR